MAFDEWIALGGNEVINNARVLGYAMTADCPMAWFKGGVCPTLASATIALENWDSTTIDRAPWYDPVLPDISRRFYGAYGLSVTGIEDSTREAAVIQGLSDGGVIGRVRKAPREVRVVAILAGEGEDALEYGMAWLSATLDPNACGQHGDACGTADLSFFSTCPPAYDGLATTNGYQFDVDKVRRFLHDVACISGPLIQQKVKSGPHWAYQVEFTLVAANPYVFGVTQKIDLPPRLPVVVQDIPFNLVPYPSAELSGGTVAVATNYSTNPSVEVNTDSWQGWGSVVSGTGPSVVFDRSTELAASGGASFRANLRGADTPGGSGVHAIGQTNVVLLGAPAGSRYSFTIWGAAVISAGSPVINSMRGVVEWRDAADQPLGALEIGAASPSEYQGRVFSAKSQAPPAGAVYAHVYIVTEVQWSDTTDLRVYADAVGVTVP
jgi:hypothetical protein